MNPTAKKINLILYRPGEGGNFLTRLFSLSEKTQFLWKNGTCGCTPKDHSIGEKLKYYSYHPNQIHDWLHEAHMTPYGLQLLQEHFDYWETNPIIIACVHYTHLYPNNGETIILGKNRKFFFVKSSDQLFDKMHTQLNMGPLQNPFMVNKMTEIIKNQTQDHDYIDLDLLINPDTFLEEYHRVCKSMELEPIDDELAIAFTENWKNIRVTGPKVK